MDTFGTICNGDFAHKLAKLLVISHAKIQMLWSDCLHLSLMALVSGKLEYFSRKILKHAGQENTGRAADSVAESTMLDQSIEETVCLLL